jgi:hypothetical protein
MKVSELITELLKCPTDAEVSIQWNETQCYNDGSGGYDENSIERSGDVGEVRPFGGTVVIYIKY